MIASSDVTYDQHGTPDTGRAVYIDFERSMPARTEHPKPEVCQHAAVSIGPNILGLVDVLCLDCSHEWKKCSVVGGL